MTTITIPKNEYLKLIEKALRYEYLREIIKEKTKGSLFSPPPVCNGNEIVKSFKRTGYYNQKFLKSLEKGLKRSSYFK